MIKVTRLNGSEVMVNAELVETVDAHPDTVIVLSNGNKIIVQEPVQKVVEKILDYRRKVYQDKREKNTGGAE